MPVEMTPDYVNQRSQKCILSWCVYMQTPQCSLNPYPIWSVMACMTARHHSTAGYWGGFQPTMCISLIIGRLYREDLVWSGETGYIPLWMELLPYLGIWADVLNQNHHNPELRQGGRAAVLHTSLPLHSSSYPPNYIQKLYLPPDYLNQLNQLFTKI